MMVRCRETVETSGKIAMRALSKLHIATTLLRDHEIARRKFFRLEKSLKFTDRKLISRLTKMRSGAIFGDGTSEFRLTCLGNSDLLRRGVTREKTCTLCTKTSAHRRELVSAVHSAYVFS